MEDAVARLDFYQVPPPGGLSGVIGRGRSTAESDKVGHFHGPCPLVGMPEKDDRFPVAAVEMFENRDGRVPSAPGMRWPFLGICGLHRVCPQAQNVHEFCGLVQYRRRVMTVPKNVPKYEVIGIVPPIPIGQLPVIFPGNPLQEPGIIPVDGPLLPIHFYERKVQEFSAASAIGPIEAIDGGEIPLVAAY